MTIASNTAPLSATPAAPCCTASAKSECRPHARKLNNTQIPNATAYCILSDCHSDRHRIRRAAEVRCKLRLRTTSESFEDKTIFLSCAISQPSSHHVDDYECADCPRMQHTVLHLYACIVYISSAVSQRRQQQRSPGHTVERLKSYEGRRGRKEVGDIRPGGMGCVLLRVLKSQRGLDGEYALHRQTQR